MTARDVIRTGLLGAAVAGSLAVLAVVLYAAWLKRSKGVV